MRSIVHAHVSDCFGPSRTFPERLLLKIDKETDTSGVGLVMACTAMITQSTGTAILEEWAKLDLSAPNSRVLRLTRVQLDDNRHPVGVEEVVLALERFPGLTANGTDIPDIIELAQRHGVVLGRATERLSIVRATKDVASRLRVGAGTDLLKLNRIVETADGQPVEWRVSFRKI